MDVLLQQWPRFVNALWLTVWMFTLVTIVSTILGAALAILADRFGAIVSFPMRIYTWIFRGVPELVILLICYLALPYIGLDLGSVGSALLAFTLIGTAFQSEIFRAGLSTVDARMIEAARGLGMSWGLMTRRVIIPQVLRVSVPSWATPRGFFGHSTPASRRSQSFSASITFMLSSRSRTQFRWAMPVWRLTKATSAVSSRASTTPRFHADIQSARQMPA